MLERVRRGDGAAFADLFARHRAPVYRYAVHMAGPGEAEDVVQEVFLALLRQVDGYDPDRGPLQPYLLGIARRMVFRRVAGARLDEQLDDEAAGETLADDGIASPFETIDRAETLERVRAAVAALPDVYREAIVLCEFNELDYAAAAGVIGCPIGTVRSRLHRARGLLAERLAPAMRRKVSANGR